MDEKTRRMNFVFPEEMVERLKRIAERKGWTVSRTVRSAIHETMKREAGKQFGSGQDEAVNG